MNYTVYYYGEWYEIKTWSENVQNNLNEEELANLAKKKLESFGFEIDSVDDIHLDDIHLT